jgi:hypothetical protein
MCGPELLDILLKYQYESDLEKMNIYYDTAPDDGGDICKIYSHEIDSKGNLILYSQKIKR